MNRVILKPKYFCSKGLTDTNEGGASGKKRGDQVASINLMKSKWGKYFSYHGELRLLHPRNPYAEDRQQWQPECQH